jgi:hypothetical protein
MVLARGATPRTPRWLAGSEPRVPRWLARAAPREAGAANAVRAG